VKQSQELKEILEDKSDEDLQSLIDELDEKIVDRKPISNKMLKRCRKKAVAESILDDRQPDNDSTTTNPVQGARARGQSGLNAFQQARGGNP